MSQRRESAVMAIKTQHKPGKGKSKAHVLNEKLKAAIADSALHTKEFNRLERDLRRARQKVVDSEAKVREIRVKLAAAGG